MKTEKITVDGAHLTIPFGLDLPFDFLATAPACCGPGSGITELAVPDLFFGLKVSAACYIHDKSWQLCKDTDSDFAHSNRMFLANLRAIINTKKASWRTPLRHLAAWWYYRAVNGRAGWVVFITRQIKNSGPF